MKTGILTLDEAARDPLAMKKFGVEIAVARAAMKHIPNCRPPLVIQREEWREGEDHAEDEPYRVAIAHMDVLFLPFIYGMGNETRAEHLKLRAMHTHTEPDDLRSRYWELVDHVAAAKAENRHEDYHGHAAEQRVILDELSRRGLKLTA